MEQTIHHPTCATTARSDALNEPALQTQTFTTGTPRHPMVAVELSLVSSAHNKLPIVMIHGGFHTGRAYLETPDGRPGWAQLFAQRGHRVVVPDWPAHGRSPGVDKIQQLNTLAVAESMGQLLRDVGPCVLMPHSAGGPLAWWLAENFPQLVLSVVGIAPGPPANLLAVLPDDPQAVYALRSDVQAGCPVYAKPDAAVTVDAEFIREFWANSPRFPISHVREYASTVVPESPRILNERFNIGGAGLQVRNPQVVSERPILIVTGELDRRHTREVDGALANYLGADFLWLPDVGIHGNGHMLMLENNSHDIAARIMTWLQHQGL
jgi:pimeloyl-ACP methyl ester carboxylesterase